VSKLHRPPERSTQRPLSPDPTRPLPSVTLRATIWHPLIYRKRIRTVEGNPRPGDLVAVYAPLPDQEEGPPQLFGYGLYNPKSEITLRMVRFSPELPDEPFWTGLLQRAVELRTDLLRLPEKTNAYRLIHGEADGFPGLVVDRFDQVLSAEAFSLGMFQRSGEILQRLARLCGTDQTLIQTAPQMLGQEGIESNPIRSANLSSPVTIQEYGTRFRVRFEEGHKTGFFCDQRENREQLARYCEGRSVLDLCCYTGGFAIQAKKLGKASEVIGVDLDEAPLQLARENANLNQVRVRFVQADVFPYMRDMLRGGKQFDVVVLDPPKLIRTRAELEEGTRKHFDLNRLAMQLVRPGGLLLSCTCAGLLPQSDFLRLLYAAARQATPRDPGAPDQRPPPRTMQILAKTGAAADHPVVSNCLETEYLSAVWMRLE
jgi:23S rRNA (cytosine1962-C5)-methyltransferase